MKNRIVFSSARLISILIMILGISSCDTRPTMNYRIHSKLDSNVKVVFTYKPDGIKTLVIPPFNSASAKSNGNGIVASTQGDDFTSITLGTNNRILYQTSPMRKKDWFSFPSGDGNFFYFRSIEENRMYVGYNEIPHKAALMIQFTEKTIPYKLFYKNNFRIDSVNINSTQFTQTQTHTEYATNFRDDAVFIDSASPVILLNNNAVVWEKFKSNFVESIRILDNQNKVLFDGKKDSLSGYGDIIPSASRANFRSSVPYIEAIEIRHSMIISLK